MLNDCCIIKYHSALDQFLDLDFAFFVMCDKDFVDGKSECLETKKRHLDIKLCMNNDAVLQYIRVRLQTRSEEIEMRFEVKYKYRLACRCMKTKSPNKSPACRKSAGNSKAPLKVHLMR